MISLSFKNILIVIITCVIIYFFISNNKNNINNTNNINNLSDYEQDYEQDYEPQITTHFDTFWTNILQIENEDSKVFQYQLPKYFNINPKYLMYHPNFTVNSDKIIQIISDNEPEAVAMLNLWVALNKGLLDEEDNFEKLFETSIRRSKNYPSVSHKFKSEINNMVYFNQEQEINKPENLEFTEDLALNEVLLDNKSEKMEIGYDAVNSFDSGMAPI